MCPGARGFLDWRATTQPSINIGFGRQTEEAEVKA
jgi:hypothetical protein